MNYFHYFYFMNYFNVLYIKVLNIILNSYIVDICKEVKIWKKLVRLLERE